MAVRIALVDKHKVVREGVRRLLESEDGFKVVATAENGRIALEQVEQYKPDVVVIEPNLPAMNGVDAARNIVHDFPDTQVLALSMNKETGWVNAMLEAGGRGYLHKSCDSGELISAVRTVAAGRPYLTPNVVGAFIRDHLDGVSVGYAPAFAGLKEREREVLQLLADGYSSKEAATEIGISVNTVHTHRQRMMEKLELENFAEVVKYAIREGLTDL